MKFYYNGKLMRTSKTHEYKFAIVWPNGKCASCHGTREAAEKEYRKRIAESETCIDRYKQAIKAIQNGKKSFIFKERSGSYKVELYGEDFAHNDRSKAETWEKYMESANECIARLKTRKIVELEARA